MKNQEFINFVADYMMNIGCDNRVAEFIAFQFALESNFGQSRLAKTRSNLCGMRIPALRPTTNIAVTGNFAKYNSDLDCLLDYALWLAFGKFSQFDLCHLDCFLDKLRAKHYCDDADYIQSIINLQQNTKF